MNSYNFCFVLIIVMLSVNFWKSVHLHDMNSNTILYSSLASLKGKIMINIQHDHKLFIKARKHEQQTECMFSSTIALYIPTSFSHAAGAIMYQLTS